MWASIVAFLALVVGFAWSASPFAQMLGAVAIAVAFVHASLGYGFRHALALLAICLVITFAIENIGVATGMPFGRYHFEADLGFPRVGSIPLIVGPLWFGMGYFSWVVAGILLDGADARLNEGGNVITLPLVAAFVMTQWDFVMDPSGSTIAKAWIWHDGGAFLGVPISNFFGWLLTSWLFFFAWAAFYLRRQDEALLQARAQSRGFRLAAIVFYLAPGLTHVTPWLLGQSGEVGDAAGHVWRISELREHTVAVMLFTMFFTSAVASLRLYRVRP
jgi:putative membrane protein